MKHAYLIIAHNEYGVLKRLLSALDDERADFYLHVDKRSKDVPWEEIKGTVRKSKLYFIPRIKCYWGGYSLVDRELKLFAAAVNKGYDYYHLLSGVSYPVKSKEDIYSFFEKNAGKNFISYREFTVDDPYIRKRMCLYHFFNDTPLSWYCNKTSPRSKQLRLLEKIAQRIQKMLGVDRLKGKKVVFCGSQWLNITHEMALYLLEHKAEIKKEHGWTVIPDEQALQNVAMTSPYRDKIENFSLHKIDWKRGSPYVFTEEDAELLLNSNCLFARKLSWDKSLGLMDKLDKALLKNT